MSGLAFLILDLSAVPPSNIQATAKANSAFTFNWNALMGRGYQVQFKADLTQTNWTNLGSRRTATNTTMTTSDPGAVDPQRFCRVFLLP